jgi:SAM-dependent methyltransferase
VSAAVDDPVRGIPALDCTDLARKVTLENRHWWYRGRRAVVSAALDRVGMRSASAILDAGCGTGHNLGLLAPLGPVIGVDLNPKAVRIAEDRGMDALCAPLERLPFTGSRFELAVCLDVLEHVKDDAAALRELDRVICSGGALVVTVPAYPSLMGEHDQAAGHVRRYSRSLLLKRANALRLRPVLMTHFNSILLPIAAAVRMTHRRASAAPKSDLVRTHAAMDGALSLPMRVEARLIRAGLDLPAGLSILAVLVKP